MKLLLDDNLSWRLEKILEKVYPDSRHVRNTNLPVPAKDTEIWEYALINNFVLVTNDDDFYKLAMTRRNCPKLIVIRTGNKSTKGMAEILIRSKDDIEKFISNKEYIILEIR